MRSEKIYVNMPFAKKDGYSETFEMTQKRRLKEITEANHETVEKKSYSWIAIVSLLLLCFLLLTAVILLVILYIQQESLIKELNEKYNEVSEKISRTEREMCSSPDKGRKPVNTSMDLTDNYTDMSETVYWLQTQLCNSSGRDIQQERLIKELNKSNDVSEKICRTQREMCSSLYKSRKPVNTSVDLIDNYIDMSEKVDWLQTEVCNSSGRDMQHVKKNYQTKDQLKDICHPSDNGQLCHFDSVLTKRWKLSQKTLYYFSVDARNWADSRRFCLKHDSDLVIIDNAEEQAFLKNNSQRNYWIGLTDEAEEGEWRWVDGRIHNITHGFWCRKEPNNAMSGNPKGEDCAALWAKATCRLSWNDENCLARFFFICEKQIGCSTI